MSHPFAARPPRPWVCFLGEQISKRVYEQDFRISNFTLVTISIFGNAKLKHKKSRFKNNCTPSWVPISIRFHPKLCESTMKCFKLKLIHICIQPHIHDSARVWEYKRKCVSRNLKQRKLEGATPIYWDHIGNLCVSGSQRVITISYWRWNVTTLAKIHWLLLWT